MGEFKTRHTLPDEKRTDSYRIKCTEIRKKELSAIVDDPLVPFPTLTRLVEDAVDGYVSKYESISLADRFSQIFKDIRKTTDTKTLKDVIVNINIIYYNNWDVKGNDLQFMLSEDFDPLFYKLYENMKSRVDDMVFAVIPYMYVKQDELFGYKIKYQIIQGKLHIYVTVDSRSIKINK